MGQTSMISGCLVFDCKTSLSVITCYLNTLEGHSIRFLVNWCTGQATVVIQRIVVKIANGRIFQPLILKMTPKSAFLCANHCKNQSRHPWA
jgi:hypothetical protein